jgi:signal transduction histidine kinase
LITHSITVINTSLSSKGSDDPFSIQAFSVCDQGPGVSEYVMERVLERFYSLPRPKGTARNSDLDLSFVCAVAELHGGRGAVASLVLPLKRLA